MIDHGISPERLVRFSFCKKISEVFDGGKFGYRVSCAKIPRHHIVLQYPNNVGPTDSFFKEKSMFLAITFARDVGLRSKWSHSKERGELHMVGV